MPARQAQLQAGNYQCPICKKSTVDMTQHWTNLTYEIERVPLPEEYWNTQIKVHCHDCDLDTDTVFHVLGNKCTECGGYNTQRC